MQGEVRTAALPSGAGDDPAARVPMFQVLQFVPQLLPLAASEGRPRSPFVGREADLAVLYDRLAIVERGQGMWSASAVSLVWESRVCSSSSGVGSRHTV